MHDSSLTMHSNDVFQVTSRLNVTQVFHYPHSTYFDFTVRSILSARNNLELPTTRGDPARFMVLTTTMREKFGRYDIGFLQHHAERSYLSWRDIRCLHVVKWDGVGRHHAERRLIPRELATTMREKFGRLGKVSYNTFLKGITLSGEIAGTWCSHLALRLAAVAAARQPQTGVKIT